MTCMFKKPENGGHPFLFSLAGPKQHFLVRELSGQAIPTAATDGRRFFWNPDWLAQLDLNQVQTVMMHESFHVLFFHTNRDRSEGKEPRKWNYAIDYVVNGVIEHDHEKSGRSSKFKLFGGALGTPVAFKDYCDYLEGKKELPDGQNIFSDPTLHGRSPESIYNDIVQAELASKRRCREDKGGCGNMSMDPKTGKSKYGAGPQDLTKTKEDPWGPDCCLKCGCPPQGGAQGLDGHMNSTMTKDEVMGEMMRAAEQAGQMRGTVPAEIEAALGELKKPTLSPRDLIRGAFQRKAIDVGNRNDWKRLRRRGLAMKPQMFLPKKHDFRPKWVALIDTSGSMSDEDIANGIKELALAGDNTDGYIVPCDAVPYWDKMTKITHQSDLKRTKITGRGGTVFDQFFAELPMKMGRDIDLVVIITDGDCGTIPHHLRPAADLLWIITNDREFKPSFGRVCKLHSART